uniref:Hepatocellular carcinoma-associated antigen 59 n=1 Tax=Panagrolaimus superbus TaxID=310955 RepID=A0A914YL61_9BILA
MADEEAPIFRKIKKRPLTSRSKTTFPSTSSAKDDDEDEVTNFEDIKEAQKIRSRKHGLNALECAVGKELARQFDDLDENPFQMRGGGQFLLTDDKKAALEAVEIEHDIKDQFKKETLLRDEHEEMKKYIAQRLNKNEDSADPEIKKYKPQNLEDEILFRAAEEIKQFTSKTNDELLSNQMLVGIPEVDLGLSSRMTNIVQTEQKKVELLKKKLPSKNDITAISPDDPSMKHLRR